MYDLCANVPQRLHNVESAAIVLLPATHRYNVNKAGVDGESSRRVSYRIDFFKET